MNRIEEKQQVKFLEEKIVDVVKFVSPHSDFFVGGQQNVYSNDQIVIALTERAIDTTMWYREPPNTTGVIHAVMKIDYAVKQLINIMVTNINYKKVVSKTNEIVIALVNTNNFEVTRISNFNDFYNEEHSRKRFERWFTFEVISTDYSDILQPRH